VFRFNKVTWSPVEIEYLQENHNKLSINQLSLRLGKSRNATQKKIDEVIHGKVVTKTKNKKSVIGKRADLNNQYVRSAWEANICRWLNHKQISYQYEPKVFPFIEFKHGTTSYCPDLFLPTTGEWIEIKGFLDGRSKTAIRRFKKYYPEHFAKLRAIVGSSNTKAAEFFKEMGVPIYGYYNELKKEFRKTIPGWEE
jgi:hypothetical protein